MYGERRSGGFRPHGGGMGMSTPPVKVGDELEVTIEAVGEKGDGLAKKNGFVLFVPGVKEGQHVKIRITKVLRKVGFAEVVGVGEAAPAAAEAPAESESFGEEAPAEEAAEEAPAEEAPAESAEDTESFGEESAEEPAEGDEQ